MLTMVIGGDKDGVMMTDNAGDNGDKGDDGDDDDDDGDNGSDDDYDGDDDNDIDDSVGDDNEDNDGDDDSDSFDNGIRMVVVTLTNHFNVRNNEMAGLVKFILVTIV